MALKLHTKCVENGEKSNGARAYAKEMRTHKRWARKTYSR